MREKLEASYTVEAAFILPVVFALLYGIIFLGFYLHDRAVLEQGAWESAFYGAGQLEEPSDADIDRYLRERIRGRLLVSNLRELAVERQKKEVTVRLLGEASALRFAQILIGYRQDTGLWVRRTVQYPSAAEYVRKGLILTDMLSDQEKR